MLNRDFLVGLVAAVALHFVGFSTGTRYAREHRPEPQSFEKPLAKVVHQDVELPKPPPKPEPEPAPEPEPKPEPKPEPEAKAPEPIKRPQPVRKKRGKPKKSAKPKKPANDKPPPSDEPPPLVLSQTYGATGAGGVAVHSGDDEFLGSGDVAPTRENTRVRERDDGVENPAEIGDGGKSAKPTVKIKIVRAKPRSRCKAEWPGDEPPGRRIVEVTLLLTIGTDGKVSGSRVLRSGGKAFDKAARAAIGRCAFVPGTRNGRAVVDKVQFVVEFKPGA